MNERTFAHRYHTPSSLTDSAGEGARKGPRSVTCGTANNNLQQSDQVELILQPEHVQLGTKPYSLNLKQGAHYTEW